MKKTKSKKGRKMKVKVKITETFEKIVYVDAQDNNEGMVKIATDYTAGKITLGQNDFAGFKIEKYEEK